MTKKIIRICNGLIPLFIFLGSSVLAQQGGGFFSRPLELEQDVQFWIRVYTEIDTDSGFIHDSKNLGMVYQTVRFSSGIKIGDRSRQIRSAVNTIENRSGALIAHNTDAQGFLRALKDDDGFET